MTQSVSKSIDREVGDLMIFSNRRCLHSRARIDGQRWLQRCYGSTLVGLGEWFILFPRPLYFWL
ncbi:TauD/TfdA family dioxygenase [Ketobacter sp. GenoA1]|uniref:TauD/TfdA family dioxygenase n=1 Tax=unclassified Ketobacter TaxID=2639109 RepID=UPI0039831077